MSATNCKNCAAPFPARNAERCEYCDTLIDRPRAELFADGVRRSADLAAQTISFYGSSGMVTRPTPPRVNLWEALINGLFACAASYIVGLRRW